MNEEHRAILMELYEALNDRDLDAALNHLAPEVEWPNEATGGHVHGRSAVRAYLQAQWQKRDPRAAPMQVDFDGAGNAHVRVHELVRSPSGAVLTDRKVEHIVAFEGPFVSRVTVIDADPNPDRDEDEEDEAR